ncbi:MAG: type II/IV secretion system ATPase subunit [Nanoarchaeota archaeon]|nr:type II/IV secretion system ATPase subunit [Nanoarchaeota archaeon]
MDEVYQVDVEGFKVEVELSSSKSSIKQYKLLLPELSKPTKALVEHIKAELVLRINPEKTTNEASLNLLKKKIAHEAGNLIDEKMPSGAQSKQFIIAYLLNDVAGLGKMEYLLNDPYLEEVVIPGAKKPVMVYHKKHGWMQTNIVIETDDQILNYSNIIARRVGRQINVLTPLLDAHLATGDRANAVLYPTSNFGNTLTIRKFAREPWTFVDFIENNTCSSGVFSIIWMAIQYEMNILFSGGTASGKTSMLNVCMPFVPLNQRVISIEDTRELKLPDYLFWNPLLTRMPNTEGKGEVNMLDLLVNSLRMRPDRIILGEVRRGEDAMVLFEAMHTGHSVYATVHADSSQETISRLTNPPIAVPANLLKAVDLNVVMFRDRKQGFRKLYQLSEFVETKGADKSSISSNILYRWVPTTNKIEPHSDSLKFFENLSRHTGLNQQEINNDIMRKKKILDWLVKNKFTGIGNIGRMMRAYYLDEEAVFNAANDNLKPEYVLGRI